MTTRPAKRLRASQPAPVADMDGDGTLDVVAVANAGVHVFAGNGDGTLDPRFTLFSLTSLQPQLVLGELDGDGIPDLVATRDVSGPTDDVLVLLNQLGE